ncbi:MarC family protein [Lutibacter sp. HS1-25]|uniref:MarC family protein n=1 Tax=Lutibacter sp. HS1-25 TaxID=2485000 RepID=UPI0010109BB3|nr:MarC family protein [Lutibacter sp. HS1-25]RXP44779.1 MarC family protein [Lutibacter sp. HS1-25]
MEQYFQATIAMLAVINPVVCGAMLLDIQKGKDLNVNIQVAFKAMFIVLIILLISAFGGKFILNVFGISEEAFKIVGGIIIGFLGFQMLFGIQGNSNNNTTGDLTKLILFAASPGTITMVMTLAAVHHYEGIPVSAVVGVIAAVLISLVIILAMLFVAAKKNVSGQGFITKFMGLIIVAMGLQFMLDGIKDFFGI